MKLSLCLEMLFTDVPFIERMGIASRLGYHAIEFWDWRDKDLRGIADAARRLGISVAAMSGNRSHALIDPGAREGLIEEMDQAFEAAKKVSCRRIMMLSDVLNDDGSAAPSKLMTKEEKRETMTENLRTLARRAEKANITLLLEPLNTVLDHRGCFLDDSTLGVEIVKRIDSPNVRLLYDMYHMSMMGEDVLKEIDISVEWIGYFHAADMPGRHQPGSGKIDYPAVKALLKRAAYQGFLGMEFSPLGPDEPAARTPLEVFND
jgi:hydroxypyruvate isomerase